MIFRKLLLLITILFCPQSFLTQAQNATKSLNFVSIKDGISKVGISSIIQDDYGFIWIGTNGSGLYKFDGVTYTSYRYEVNAPASLSSNLIYSMYLDTENTLWVGTEDGLNRYNKSLDRFEKVFLGSEVLANISILSIGNSKDNELLLGTEAGLIVLKTKTLESKYINDYDGRNTIIQSSLKLESESHQTFLGTLNGLRVYNEHTKQVLLPSSELENTQVFQSQIQTLVFDKEDNLWLGTISEGIYKLTLKNGTTVSKVEHFPLSRKRILSAITLSDNSLLFGSENDGLFHLRSDGTVIKHYLSDRTDDNSILSNSIWSLFLDDNERVWMGYYNNGVAVSDKLYDKFNNIESLSNNENSLKEDSVTGMSQDASGDIWIVMDGGGLDIYSPISGKITHVNGEGYGLYQGLDSDYLQTIFIDSKENVWIGSWDNGIYFLKKGSRVFKNFNRLNTDGALISDAILSFDEDENGTIFIGTFYGGLHTLDPVTKTIVHQDGEAFKSLGIETSDVRKVLVDRDSAIWLGSTDGLFKIDQSANKEWRAISLVDRMEKPGENRKSARHILSLFQSSNGDMWIGTRGAGVCHYSIRDDSFRWLNTNSGLSNDNVVSIIEGNDGNMWFAGNSGITKYDVLKNTFTEYTSSDGLLSNDFNFNAVLKDGDGTLYFGNYRGVDFFNPAEIVINNNVPSLYFTGLKIYNEEVDPSQENAPIKKSIAETSEIIFNHKQSVFTIEYAGVSFTRPEKNQYAYYLEGLETSWNYVGNARSATYTNLDNGDYTFKVKVANNDGVWNEDVLELKIKILPPWWKTNLAIVCYILLFVLGLYIISKISKQRLREKEAISNERAQREQEDILHEKKLQFFTNISHEFRTPLTLMISPLKDILNDTTLNLPQRIKEKHHIIYKNTDRLFRLINELMDLRKLELNKLRIRAKKINALSFTQDIISYFKEETFNRNIYLSVDAAIPDVKLYADEGMLEKVIFNIMSNAIKVTPDGGAINIEVKLNEAGEIMPLINPDKKIAVVEIIISDTGPGLKKKQLKRIFNRFYQVENLNKTYYGGTGIGLEVVKDLVQLHRGEIRVDSKYGEGTTFRILLPSGKKHFKKKELISIETDLEIQKEKTPQTFITNIPEEIDVVPTHRSHTLLIVEDNTELRKYLRSELKGTYKILQAANGVEGLNVAKEANPDIIITDVIMPEMDGFEFCKQIKNDIRTSHIPLLMLTAKARIDDRIEGIGYGADAYMVKPFDFRLLKLRLEQLIKSRQLIFDKYFGAISGSDENASATSIDKVFIQKVLTYVNNNMSDSNLSVESLASELSLSRSQLYRKVKSLTGQTVNEFVRKLRLERAKQILQTENANVSEVCYKVGFSSPSYFTKCFKAHFGILPTEAQPRD